MLTAVVTMKKVMTTLVMTLMISRKVPAVLQTTILVILMILMRHLKAQMWRLQEILRWILPTSLHSSLPLRPLL